MINGGDDEESRGDETKKPVTFICTNPQACEVGSRQD